MNQTTQQAAPPVAQTPPAVTTPPVVTTPPATNTPPQTQAETPKALPQLTPEQEARAIEIVTTRHDNMVKLLKEKETQLEQAQQELMGDKLSTIKTLADGTEFNFDHFKETLDNIPAFVLRRTIADQMACAFTSKRKIAETGANIAAADGAKVAHIEKQVAVDSASTTSNFGVNAADLIEGLMKKQLL